MEENGQHGHPHEHEPRQAMTAYIVVVWPDGKAVADSNLLFLSENDIVVERVATLDDMWRACGEVRKDVEIMQQANYTVNAYMAAAQQMMQAQKDARFAQKLQEKGLRLP